MYDWGYAAAAGYSAVESTAFHDKLTAGSFTSPILWEGRESFTITT
jgi:hypothetical protein